MPPEKGVVFARYYQHIKEHIFWSLPTKLQKNQIVMKNIFMYYLAALLRVRLVSYKLTQQ